MEAVDPDAIAETGLPDVSETFHDLLEEEGGTALEERLDCNLGDGIREAVDAWTIHRAKSSDYPENGGPPTSSSRRKLARMPRSIREIRSFGTECLAVCDSAMHEADGQLTRA
jgi:hypothetical protein